MDAHARFRVPVSFGDAVEIGSHVSKFRRSSFDVEHRLWLRGEVAVEGRETRVWPRATKKTNRAWFRLRSRPRSWRSSRFLCLRGDHASLNLRLILLPLKEVYNVLCGTI